MAKVIVTKFLVIAVTLLFAAMPAHADKTSATYISALPTVPLMPGLQEVGNSEVLFDKAEGRIAVIDAYGPDLHGQNIARYYREVLPELGWTETGNMVFARQDEVLAIRLNNKASDDKGGIAVTFDLQPK